MEAEKLRPNLKSRSKADIYFVRNLASGGTTGEGSARHGGGGYLDSAVILGRMHWTMSGDKLMLLLLCLFPPLDWVLLFNKGWRAEEWNSRRNRAHEFTNETYEIG